MIPRALCLLDLRMYVLDETHEERHLVAIACSQSY